MSPASRSAGLAAAARNAVAAHGVESNLLDLRDHDLPLCDGGSCYAHPSVRELSDAIGAADLLLVALPIYNYGVNAAAKNLVELTGPAWTGKTVGFLCSAGGTSSHMAVMGFANTLMLDCRCLVLPRFVYAAPDAADAGGTPTAALAERIEALAAEGVRVASALAEAPAAAVPA
ncbi:FMN reductase [Phycisphaera mikurensis]|nr:FMN reductase [Phycisphaera mikurensis]